MADDSSPVETSSAGMGRLLATSSLQASLDALRKTIQDDITVAKQQVSATTKVTGNWVSNNQNKWNAESNSSNWRNNGGGNGSDQHTNGGHTDTTYGTNSKPSVSPYDNYILNGNNSSSGSGGGNSGNGRGTPNGGGSSLLKKGGQVLGAVAGGFVASGSAQMQDRVTMATTSQLLARTANGGGTSFTAISRGGGKNYGVFANNYTSHGLVDSATAAETVQGMGYAAQSGGFNTSLNYVRSAGLVNPGLSQAQSSAAMYSLHSASTYNSMRMLGINTIGKGGTPTSPRALAEQLLQRVNVQMRPGTNIEATIGQNSHFGSSLAAMVSSGMLDANTAQQVTDESRQILVAKQKGISYSDYNNTLNKVAKGDPTTKTNRATLARLGMSPTAANNLMAMQGHKTNQLDANLGGFVGGLDKATSVVNDFSNALTKFLRGPAGQALGYGKGMAGGIAGSTLGGAGAGAAALLSKSGLGKKVGGGILRGIGRAAKGVLGKATSTISDVAPELEGAGAIAADAAPEVASGGALAAGGAAALPIALPVAGGVAAVGVGRLATQYAMNNYLNKGQRTTVRSVGSSMASAGPLGTLTGYLTQKSWNPFNSTSNDGRDGGASAGAQTFMPDASASAWAIGTGNRMTETDGQDGGYQPTKAPLGTGGSGKSSGGGGSGKKVTGSVGAGKTASAVIAVAMKYLGVPYVWGGASPKGFDCSGLMQYSFGQIGVSLPRVATDQQRAGTAVPVSKAQAGDLVFYGGNAESGGAYHVMLYLGNCRVIEAPQPGGHVQTRSVSLSSLSSACQVLGTVGGSFGGSGGDSGSSSSGSSSAPTGPSPLWMGNNFLSFVTDELGMLGVSGASPAASSPSTSTSTSSTGSGSGTGGSSGIGTAPPSAHVSGTVSSWVSSALGIMGMDKKWAGDLDVIIKGETGGNPHAINRTDSNARAGHPSMGIMQTIMSTFKQFAMPGHNSSPYDPVSDIIAGTKYALSRYGNLDNVPGVVSERNGGAYQGYSVGSTRIDVDQTAQLHRGEMIIPAHQAEAIRSALSSNSPMSSLSRGGNATGLTIEKGAINVTLQGDGSQKNGVMVGTAVVDAITDWQRKKTIASGVYSG